MPKSKKKAVQNTKAMDPKAPVRHRVVQARMPRELGCACHALSRHVRDIGNTCIYLGRTALDCFGWDVEGKKSVLKSSADFPKDGQAVLEAFNAAISKPCPGFACTQKVSLGHEIWSVSKAKWRPWAPQAKPKNHASFFEGEAIGAPSVFQCGGPAGQPHFET